MTLCDWGFYDPHSVENTLRHLNYTALNLSVTAINVRMLKFVPTADLVLVLAVLLLQAVAPYNLDWFLVFLLFTISWQNKRYISGV